MALIITMVVRQTHIMLVAVGQALCVSHVRQTQHAHQRWGIRMDLRVKRDIIKLGRHAQDVIQSKAYNHHPQQAALLALRAAYRPIPPAVIPRVHLKSLANVAIHLVKNTARLGGIFLYVNKANINQII